MQRQGSAWTSFADACLVRIPGQQHYTLATDIRRPALMRGTQERVHDMRRAGFVWLLLIAAVSLPAQAQRRCGAPPRMGSPPADRGEPADCGYWTNSPQPEYAPDAGCLYEVQVVFHVIQHTSGEGFVSAETLQDQIDVLNEDFQAIPGSPGGPGTNAKIRFRLATIDPEGNPTTGITYTMNDRWFDDRGNYGDTLTWDSNRYMNVYTNEASGNYGYVNGFACEGNYVGTQDDYIVINWKTIGREGTPWWTGNMGPCRNCPVRSADSHCYALPSPTRLLFCAPHRVLLIRPKCPLMVPNMGPLSRLMNELKSCSCSTKALISGSIIEVG